MSSTKNKLRLAGAFAALATLALAVSCTGFFQNPTVSTITIDPPTPSVAVNSTVQLTAAATYNDGSTGNLTGGTSCTGNTVCWSSSDPTTATVSTGGLLTGVAVGTVTINAASGSITGTTTATVAEVITSITISPTSSSIVDNGECPGTGCQEYTVNGVTPSGTQNIGGLVTLTAYPVGSTTAATNVSCVYDGSEFVDCTPTEASVTTTTTYTIVVTYSGYTGSTVSATLTVSPSS